MRCETVLFVLLALHAGGALAGIGTYTGEEDGFWRDTAAVYAQVMSVAELGPGHVEVTLNIIATFTGAYDAGANPVLKTQLYYGGKVSAIRNAPKAGVRVIAILERPRDLEGRLLDRYLIPSAFMKFMPNQAAILEVKDFEDPQLQEVISCVRGLRVPVKPAGK